MNWKTCISWMSLLLVYPTLALGQLTTLNFEVLPGSTYSYSPGGFGLAGCSPNNLTCEYALEGLFSLEIDSSNGSASITNSNLMLTGNETVSGPPLTTESGLEAWLENQDLFNSVIIDALSVTTFGFQVENQITELNPLTLFYDSPGTDGSLTGTFSIGDGLRGGLSFQASLRQVAVPEPSAATILGLFTVAAFHVRRRHWLA